MSVKWSKIEAGDHKSYTYCYGAPFIIQISGSGLVAPCGMLFNEKYKDYHIGNIKEKRFKEIWESDRYWEVMHMISHEPFDCNKDCGRLCLQHKTNEVMWDIKNDSDKIPEVNMNHMPQHINFI